VSNHEACDVGSECERDAVRNMNFPVASEITVPRDAQVFQLQNTCKRASGESEAVMARRHPR